jgi:hypothetical protein
VVAVWQMYKGGCVLVVTLMAVLLEKSYRSVFNLLPTLTQASNQHHIENIQHNFDMCGTETSRPVLGGTIAILKSLNESTLPDLSLLFHQTEASTTTATFQSTSIPEATTDAELSSCQIVILYVTPRPLPFNGSMYTNNINSRDGDLRASSLMTSILHAFPLSAFTTESFSLPRKLDLGVGGEGIIGRRVGLVRQTQVLRQGIIGWN